MKTKNKKGQIITSLIGGIAALIILVIVSLLVVNTLNDAGLLSTSSTTAVQNAATLTYTGLTLTECNADVGSSVTAIAIINQTNITGIVPTSNYTTTGCVVTLTGASVYNQTAVNVTYTYTANSDSQNAVDSMISNYTVGVDNVSEKVPTVLLIAAVVLLFGAIVFLVQRSRAITSGQGGGV